MVKSIAVVGGGISGLSAAFYARKLCRERGLEAKLTIIEQDHRLGGKIRTLHRDGFTIEQGPDSFLARKQAALDLARDLGLEDQLTGTNPAAKTNYILHRNKLHTMPPGLMLGIPTQMWPMVKTGLLSPLGKARAALDLVLPAKRGNEDESLGGFIQRRLGKEVLEHMTEPLLAGIYAGDTAQLSLKATFPQFMEMERKHRSLILGLLASKKPSPLASASAQVQAPVQAQVQAQAQAHAQAAAAALPGPARTSMFLTFKGGLSVLVDALVKSLETESVITGAGVCSIMNKGDGYELILSDGELMTADAVVIAAPAFAAAQMLANVPEAGYLERIQYVSVANAALAFRREDVPRELNGSGFLIPRSEGRRMTAVTWTSSKWLHTAPDGSVLLRAYIGRLGDQRWTAMRPEEIIAGVSDELRDLMGITAKPIFAELARLPESMPQYPVGHPDELAKLRAKLDKTMPRVLLCGGGYDGVGIPDCIRQGRAAAEQLVTSIAGR
ncbi:protoporphyrinogen oxidase [Paenibacillus sp. M1]|uniref:Coproporphyrinogen III oxidase n=1 Tax=Paenibacillus haidiansis TaxID=1574488 RepID=A0ABU7VYJ9_9BACL